VECASPAALTEQPRHLFTARFLGARSVLEGRPEAGVFRAPDLPPIALPDGARPTHLVLRAARLRLLPPGAATDAPLVAAARIEAATRLDDAIHYEIVLGPHRLRVRRPTAEPAFAPGAEVILVAPAEAMSWIEDFETTAGEAA
jgi:putative spermidine/putrescine transport system ATP-binding protein